ncbi:NAD+ kinase [Mycena indigotica]|uniref:NAD+ kinase n=1 Tax=Mycena indigotica TaxID=2126181 RepID=A0A8H6TGF8_9AGAR|nr:NAD+ kinase [Mycena indigotica]KAF7315295.1 NAD+ kinase [Mycena indigotica]
MKALAIGLYISDESLMTSHGWKSVNEFKIAELMNVQIHVERPHETLPVVVGELGGPMYEIVKLVTATLNETGAILQDSGYTDMGFFIAQILQRAQANVDVFLEHLVRTLPTFQDMAVVDEQPIYCFSKALFLVHTISVRFSSANPPPFPLPSVGSALPILSGNAVPSLLVHLQVIQLSASSQLSSISLPVASPGLTTSGPIAGPPITLDQSFLLRAAAIFALRSSAPSEWTPDVVLDEASPIAKKGDNSTMTPTTTATVQRNHHHHIQREQPMHSPCFVHSHLDKGVSLTDWLRLRQNGTDSSESRSSLSYDLSSSSSTTSSTVDSPDDDDFSSSLTKQLAETAVGVREMSKQLGRARVRSNIQNVLIITKARDNRLIQLTRQLALYLMLKPRQGQSRGLVVYVDHQLRASKRFDAEGIQRDHPELFVPVQRRKSSSSTSLPSMAVYKEEQNLKETGQLRYWTSDMCSHSPHLFDFVVTLGGDGTVLFTSWLFQRIVPPVLPFALGSLGFLTNFDFADHRTVMDAALDSGIRVNLRMRFTCTVYRAVVNEDGKRRKAVKKGHTGEIMMKNVEQGGWEALESGWSGGPELVKATSKDKEIMCFTTRAVETFEVLNDLVVDRGPSPYVSQLELFGDEHHMTTVQADGLTVSTPTGSTAYSLSAGGSLVHPEIPAILITPICPHTLSFRPMLLPDSMELRICVPFDSRSTAWASFDGRGRVELKQGDHIKVTPSKFPFPTVCADNQSTDWFQAISRTLKWNERERQKSFVMVEEDAPTRPKKKRVKQHEPVEELVEDEEEDEVTDEEEKFDIDDSSPEAAAAAAALKTQQTPDEEALGREKALEIMEEDRLHRLAASALKKERSRSAKSRSRSRQRTKSATPHVEFHLESSEPRRGGRIPKEKEPELDSVTTPTVGNLNLPYHHGRGRGHSRTRSADVGPRAFAVWGQDESDSNASDSDDM